MAHCCSEAECIVLFACAKKEIVHLRSLFEMCRIKNFATLLLERIQLFPKWIVRVRIAFFPDETFQNL